MIDYLKPDRHGAVALACILLAAALLYFATLDNGVSAGNLMGGDLITHQYAQVQARPSNAPGYPLYTMGGWLWFHGWRTLLPSANPIAILSGYSMLWGVLALGLLFLLLYKLSERNLIVSAGLSAYYALTYFFWFYSVTSEQYTSAILLTLGMVALALAWDESNRDRYLYGLAFLFGVALAHMLTVLFVAPGILLFILSKKPDLLRRGRLIAQAFLVALIPLISYAFVYVRGAQHPEWRGAGDWASTGQWFLAFISTQQGRDELTWTLGPLTDGFPAMIWQEISLILLALGVVGWALLGRRHLLMFGLTAVIYLLFSYVDRFGNWYQVIMPLYPLLLLGAGVSLTRLWRASPQRVWRVALTLGLLALIIPKFFASYPLADQRNRPDDTGLEPGRAILAAVPADAIVLAATEERLALDYLATVWEEGADVQVINTKKLGAVLAADPPVFVTRQAAAYAARETRLPLRYNGWHGEMLLVADGELPLASTTGLTSLAQPLGDGLQMVGYRLQAGDTPSVWDVNFALAADAAPVHDWAISVRLLQGDAEIAQQDHPAPAQGFTPTTAVVPGDVVTDSFRFHLAPDQQPDGMRILLYRQLADGDFVNLADLRLAPTSDDRHQSVP